MSSLIVLNSSPHFLYNRFSSYFRQIISSSQKRIYIHLLPSQCKWPPLTPLPVTYLGLIHQIYLISASIFQDKDVRVLFHELKSNSHVFNEIYFEKNCSSYFKKEYVDKYIGSTQAQRLILENEDDEKTGNVEEEDIKKSLFQISTKQYDHVVLGGTFDRLHVGHKMLLTEAVVRSRKSVTIGVTDDIMLRSKCLYELILPLKERIVDVECFLKELNDELEFSILPIFEPFGPSVIDSKFDCIVGSEETLQGCEKINEKRLENSLKTCDIHIIPLASSLSQKDKISSSGIRKSLLGTLLKKPNLDFDGNYPYIIGLTGGSCSGKSTIIKYISSKYSETAVIDCDRLAHNIYAKGTEAFNSIVEAFGSLIIDQESGEINRSILGALVFKDSKKLEELENLIWPAIYSKILCSIKDYKHVKIVILDAAVLFKAGWNSICHIIWGTFIPRNEAILRIMKRDFKTFEEAEKRLNSQTSSNDEIIQKSNILLCSLWEKQFTESQVDKAMSYVYTILKNERI